MHPQNPLLHRAIFPSAFPLLAPNASSLPNRPRASPPRQMARNKHDLDCEPPPSRTSAVQPCDAPSNPHPSIGPVPMARIFASSALPPNPARRYGTMGHPARPGSGQKPADGKRNRKRIEKGECGRRPHSGPTVGGTGDSHAETFANARREDFWAVFCESGTTWLQGFNGWR